jgi:hypothetical protein
MSDIRSVEIYRAENDIAAHLIKGSLEAAGIPTQITEESYGALRVSTRFGGPRPAFWSPRLKPRKPLR